MPLAAQLQRIEDIQKLLRTLLLEDRPAGLDELLAEKRSRLETVLAGHETEEFGSRPVYARLLRILRTDHELQSLITSQLTVLGTELRKAHEAKQLASAYVAKPSAHREVGLVLQDISV